MAKCPICKRTLNEYEWKVNCDNCGYEKMNGADDFVDNTSLEIKKMIKKELNYRKLHKY